MSFLLNLFGGSWASLIKYGLIICLVLSIVGYGTYKWNSVNNALEESQQRIELLVSNQQILEGNVLKLEEINTNNQKVLDFIKKNQKFLQKLEKDHALELDQKKAEKDAIKKTITRKELLLGNKQVTPLLGESLNIIEGHKIAEKKNEEDTP